MDLDEPELTLPQRIETMEITPALTDVLLPRLIDTLIPPLIQVESGGDDRAIGDGGKAVGCLQLWKIYVDDVNRIDQYKTEFTYQDRYDRDKSIAMVKIFLAHYGKMKRVKPSDEDQWLRMLAAMHRGPQRYRDVKAARFRSEYANRVMDAYKEIYDYE